MTIGKMVDNVARWLHAAGPAKSDDRLDAGQGGGTGRKLCNVDIGSRLLDLHEVDVGCVHQRSFRC